MIRDVCVTARRTGDTHAGGGGRRLPRIAHRWRLPLPIGMYHSVIAPSFEKIVVSLASPWRMYAAEPDAHGGVGSRLCRLHRHWLGGSGASALRAVARCVTGDH